MAKRRFIKHKILLDEALAPRQTYSTTNQIFNVKHIKHDLNLGGVADEIVYKVAKELGRIIVTPNIKDFRKLFGKRRPSKKTGIIAVSMALKSETIDNKLCSFLKNSYKGDLYGEINNITGETGKN